MKRMIEVCRGCDELQEYNDLMHGPCKRCKLSGEARRIMPRPQQFWPKEARKVPDGCPRMMEHVVLGGEA